METKVLTDLDAIDRHIAELRGWKWDDDYIGGGDSPTTLGVWRREIWRMNLESGFHALFQPTRDARQAMVLLAEMPAPVLVKRVKDWECTFWPDLGCLQGEHGNTPLIAICKAWISWKEATVRALLSQSFL